MKKFYCENCLWEGTEDKLMTIWEPNLYNPLDNTLYEHKVCPTCKQDDALVEKVAVDSKTEEDI